MIVAAIGCLIAWLSNLLLAGFGELVLNTHVLLAIAEKTAKIEEQSGDMANSNKVVTKSGIKPTNIEQPKTVSLTDPLIRRALILLEGGDWAKAENLFEQALIIEPENPRAYIGKLCARLQLCGEDKLADYESPISDYPEYRRALQFADAKYKRTLKAYALTSEERNRNQTAEEEELYQSIINRIDEVRSRKNSKECTALVSELEQLGEYKDALDILRELSTPISDGSKFMECPFCGTTQGANRLVCLRCGVRFYKEADAEPAE